MAGGMKLAPLMTEIKVDINGFKNDMQKAASMGVTEADKIGKRMSVLTKAGEGLSKAGSLLTKTVSVPLVAAGTYAVKTAIDFETAYTGVTKTVDGTDKQLRKLKQGIIDMSKEIPSSTTEIAAVAEAAGQLGIQTDNVLGFTRVMIDLGNSTNLSAEEGASALAKFANVTGMSQKDFSRLGSVIVDLGNNFATTESDIVAMGMRLAGAGTQIGMTEPQIMGFATALSSVGIEAEAGGSAFSTLMANMQLSVEKGGEGLQQFADVAGMSAEQFQTSFRDNASGAIIQFIQGLANCESQGQSAIKVLDDMGITEIRQRDALLRAAGASGVFSDAIQTGTKAWDENIALTNEAEKRYATTESQIEITKNQIAESARTIGVTLLPVVKDVIGDISELTSKFANLSDEQKDNILHWAKIAIVVGPVLSIAGKGITIFTSLQSAVGGVSTALKFLGGSSAVTAGTTLSGTTVAASGLAAVCAPLALGVTAAGVGLYALHESSQLSKRGVNEASDSMSGMERVIAKLSGTEIYSREELEKMGYVHKEFSKNISPEFQAAVEDSTKKVEDFNVFLHEIGFNDVISQSESDAFNQRVTDTCDTAIQAIQSKKAESQAALKGLFVADDGVVDEGEKKVLDILSKSSDAQIEEVNRLKGEIITIKQKAVDDGRALNEQEIKDIEAKNARIHQLELESVGGTQEEIAYAKNEFNERIKSMDLKSASELMQEKAKNRDDEVIKIKASYNTQIDLLKSKLKDCTGEEKAALEQQISNLSKDRDGKVKIQEDLYQSYLDIMGKNNPKLLDGINKYNGQVLTNEDLYQQKMLAKYTSHYKGLDQITKSGCYTMYNTLSDSYTQVAVKIDQKTGEIIGFHDKTNNLTAGYSKSMADSTQKMANKQSASFQQIISAEGMYVDYTSGSVCLANGQAVASMQDLKANTDGTRQGIININNTPYEIKVNSDGTIASLRAINEEADYASRARTIVMRAEYHETSSGILYSGADDYIHRSFNGVDNVPYDGYTTVLHKNERVLTAKENEAYTQGQSIDYTKMQQCLKAAVKELSLSVGNREIGRVVDARLRERGLLAQ